MRVLRFLAGVLFVAAAAGLAFVVTCLRGKPLAYYASQRVAAPTDAERSEWSGFWATEPVFRRRFRVMSLVIGGALLADAAHVATDAAGLALALFAAAMSTRPPSDTRTYGWQRTEHLALEPV